MSLQQTRIEVTDSPELVINESILNLWDAPDSINDRLLSKDILKHGCLNPLVVWDEENTILDGHRRYKICKQLGIGFRQERLSFSNLDDAIQWIVEYRLSARIITPLEYASHIAKYRALRLSPVSEPAAKDIAPPSIDKIYKNIKKKFNYRERYLSNNIESYLSAISIKVNQDRKLYNRRRKRNLIRRKIDERHNSVKLFTNVLNFGWNLGTWESHIGKLEDRSVRLLLTDPPYGVNYTSPTHRKIRNDKTPIEAQSEFERMITSMDGKLADDAHILCFINWKYEPSFRLLLENMGYEIRGSIVWIKNVHTCGNYSKTFASQHERIIHAVKGNPNQIKFHTDVFEEKHKPSIYHPTPKPLSLLMELISATTVVGELVADPFGGIASTLVAAYLLNRRCWGAEIDDQYFLSGLARLYEAQNLNHDLPGNVQYDFYFDSYPSSLIL